MAGLRWDRWYLATILRIASMSTATSNHSPKSFSKNSRFETGMASVLRITPRKTNINHSVFKHPAKRPNQNRQKQTHHHVSSSYLRDERLDSNESTLPSSWFPPDHENTDIFIAENILGKLAEAPPVSYNKIQAPQQRRPPGLNDAVLGRSKGSYRCVQHRQIINTALRIQPQIRHLVLLPRLSICIMGKNFYPSIPCPNLLGAWKC